MKINKYSIVLIVTFGLLFSCNSYDNPKLNQNEFLGNPIFDVSVDKIDLDLNGKTTQIDVATNIKWWIIKSNSSWVKVPSDTLYGNANVEIVILENTTTDSRVANITLSSGVRSPKKTVVITQKGLPSHVNVSTPKITTDGYGGTYEVNVTSNATWIVTVKKLTEPNIDWITVSPTTGRKDGKIVISINKNVNEAIDKLEATVIVSVADQEMEIAVEQIGNAACDAPDNTKTIYFNNFFPCENAPVGSTWTLTDPRDNKTYRVRLMADGNIWMIDDLKFSGNTGKQKANLNVFGGDGNAAKGYYFPNYYGDVTDIRIYSQIPVERGYFYGWQTIIQSEFARNAGGWSTNMVLEPEYQGIAPDGWQVPSAGQFENLYTKIGFAGFVSDWEVTYGGNINYNGASNEGVNSYGSYWTITQKNRDKTNGAGAHNNTILTWRINNTDSSAATADSPRNYGNVVRLLKKKVK